MITIISDVYGFERTVLVGRTIWHSTDRPYFCNKSLGEVIKFDFHQNDGHHYSKNSIKTFIPISPESVLSILQLVYMKRYIILIVVVLILKTLEMKAFRFFFH